MAIDRLYLLSRIEEIEFDEQRSICREVDAEFFKQGWRQPKLGCWQRACDCHRRASNHRQDRRGDLDDRGERGSQIRG